MSFTFEPKSYGSGDYINVHFFDSESVRKDITDGTIDDRASMAIGIAGQGSGSLKKECILTMAECRELGAKLLGIGMDPENPEAMWEALINPPIPQLGDELITYDELTNGSYLLNVINQRINHSLIRSDWEVKNRNNSHNTYDKRIYRLSKLWVDDSVIGQYHLDVQLKQTVNGIETNWRTKLDLSIGSSVRNTREALSLGSLDPMTFASHHFAAGGIVWKKNE